MKTLLTVSAIALILLGIVMIVIGAIKVILPPPVTGVGFILIAVVFFRLRQESKK